MIRNYLKIALRNLFRNRTYSIINIFGLGLGISVGFVLLYWVNNEYTMNAYHKNADRIYQVNAKLEFGGKMNYWDNVPAPVAAYSREHIPDIETIVRLRQNVGFNQVVKVGDQVFVEKRLGYTENELFRIFDFPLVKGDSKAPFTPGPSVVLTESTARRYFGNENPIGKMIWFRDTTIQVSAVMKDFPENSSLQLDMLFSLDLQKLKFRGNGQFKTIDTDWGNYDYTTFCIMKEGGERAKVSGILKQALKKAYGETSFLADFTFRPLKDIYLYKVDGSKGKLVMVEIFLVLGIFILLIAAINYVNLVTARATQRVKEISVRKILGAGKRQLFIQFFCETGMLLTFSLATALLLVQLLLPVYRQVTATNLQIHLFDWQLWKVLAMLVGSIWVLSGLYPALLLSSFRPVQALRGTGIFANTGAVRKSLVVLQFVVGISLVMGTVFIHRQMKFLQEKNLNLNTDNVIVFPIWRLRDNGAVDFTNQLQQMTGVTGTTTMSGSLFDGVNSTADFGWPGKGPDDVLQMGKFEVDRNFLRFFDLEVLEGRNLDNVSPGNIAYVLNETAVRKMGLEEPLGKEMTRNDDHGPIIGVVKDFNFESLHREVMPIVIYISPESQSFLYVRVQPQHNKKLVAAAEKIWKQYEPLLPMEYHFLDDQIAANYERETRASSLFDTFAIVTMLISCLGLFGLTTYSAERRVKEIGIRKVLGAGVSNIAVMLSTEFIKLVIIATVISIPVVWYAMSRLLQDYAYRVSLHWSVFALTALAAIGIAVFTMSFQAIRAGLANPVKSLRTE